jgi:hypothetical protein
LKEEISVGSLNKRGHLHSKDIVDVLFPSVDRGGKGKKENGLIFNESEKWQGS